MDGRTRLAKAFGDWIELNGWTQTEVVAMGGPSTLSALAAFGGEYVAL